MSSSGDGRTPHDFVSLPTGERIVVSGGEHKGTSSHHQGPGGILSSEPSDSSRRSTESYRASAGTDSLVGRRGADIRAAIEARLADCRDYAARQAEGNLNAGESAPREPVPRDQYVLLEPVGEGSYGSVWKAHHSDASSHIVAIKFFPRGVERAEDLAKELENLRHLTSEQGFIQLLDINLRAEWPYFVMTYAPGSLQKLRSARGQLAVRDVVRVFERVVKAMAHAHSKEPGLCHCDLKPSNILLTPDGTPLIADFGQSRLMDRKDRAAFGTLFYMPPDQASTGRYDPSPSWDVYALGAIAYAMLTPEGVPPRYDGWSKLLPTLSKKHLEGQLLDYREHLVHAPAPKSHHAVPGMDRRFADIIDKCLELEPANRYPDARALQEALLARKRAKRRRPIIYIGVIATLVCLTAATVIAVMFRDQTVARHRQDLSKQVQSGLRSTAFVAARLLEDKFRRRVQFLERAVDMGVTSAPPPGSVRHQYAEAKKALVDARSPSTNRADTVLANRWLADDRHAVDQWLKGVAERAGKEQLFENGLTVTLCCDGAAYNFSRVYHAEDGTWQIENPWQNQENLRQFTRDFSWRDWYGHTGYDLTEQHPITSPRRPVEDTHISVVYRSTKGPWMVSITCPIRAFDPNTGREEVVALLGGPVNVRTELTSWMDEAATPRDCSGPRLLRAAIGGGTSLFADPAEKERDLLVVNERDFLVWRPDLDLKIPNNPDDERTLLDDGSKYTRLQKYVGWKDKLLTLETVAVTQFDDPWDDDTAQPGVPATMYLASHEEFYPLGRSGEQPWHVIVQHEESKALGPVETLQHEMIWWGLGVFGGFLAVASLLWGGVFYALRHTEGDSDA